MSRVIGSLVCCLTSLNTLTTGAQPSQDEKGGKQEAILHDGRSLAEWVGSLKDDNAEVRLKAARALVAIGEPAYPALSDALSNSYQPVWKTTVESLVRIGEPAIPALLAAIRLERSGDLRGNGGIAAIQQMGVAAHPALKKLLDDKDPDVRVSAAVALRLQMMGPDQDAVISLLADVLRSNKDARVRMTAAESLGLPWMAPPQKQAALSALLPALKDPEKDVQGMAAVSLVQLNLWRGHELVPALITALQSKEEEGMLPSLAAEALGKLGPAADSAVPALIETMQRNDPFTADRAAEALGKIGQVAVPALREALNSSSDTVRSYAAKALGSTGATSEDIIPQLLDLLKQGAPSVRAAAALALGEAQADSDEAVAALIKAIGDRKRDVRNAAIHALGRIGSKATRAVPALITLLGRPERFDQTSVMRTLGSIGPGARQAIPALKALLPNNAMDAATALARIGPAAVPTLAGALKNEEAEVRQGAAWGLRYLGPDAREAVPALAELVRVDEKACGFAMQALAAIGSEAAPAVHALIGVLREGDKGLQSCAFEALREIGPVAKGAKDAVLKAMETGDSELRWDAAITLMAMGEVDAGLPVVLLKLQGADKSVEAVEVLITAGAKARSAAPAIAEVMSNKKAAPSLRLKCAEALTRVAPGDERGLDFLREQVADSEGPLSIQAASLLMELGKGDEAAIRRLKVGLAATDPSVSIACAGALTQVQSERDTATRFLCERLQGKDGEARLVAALALSSAGVVDATAVRMLGGELRKEGGSGRPMEAIRALGRIFHTSKEARVILEDALHHECDTVRTATRTVMPPSK